MRSSSLLNPEYVVRRMGPVLQFCYLHTLGQAPTSHPNLKSLILRNLQNCRTGLNRALYAHVLGTREDELLGEYVVSVSYLKMVARSDLLASVLDDQHRPRVLVIIRSSVNQYHCVWVEVFTSHDQLLAATDAIVILVA
jgi:hypothetical protein